jgi:ABC-type nitrate/sulfonate/bicarbonate transport system substrate-binding protein
MLAGEAPIVLAGGEPVVELGLKGGDAIFIGGISIVPAIHFMAMPEIRSVQDLRGKPVGVTRFGSSTDYGMRQVLRRNGLETVEDVPVLQIAGGHRGLAIALLNRSILVAPIAPPNSLYARKGGAKLLVDMTQSGIYFSLFVDCEHARFFETEPAGGSRFHEGLFRRNKAHEQR